MGAQNSWSLEGTAEQNVHMNKGECLIALFIMNWPYVTYIESTEMYPYDYEIKLQCLIGRDKTLTRFG